MDERDHFDGGVFDTKENTKMKVSTMRKLFFFTAGLAIAMFIGKALAYNGNGGIVHDEAFYAEKVCKIFHGKQEVRLIDGTRADCITENYAVEVDRAYKWAECVGQSQKYARDLEKTAGCVLLMADEGDLRFLERAVDAYLYHEKPFKVWFVPTWESHLVYIHHQRP